VETRLPGADADLYDLLPRSIIEVAPKEKVTLTVADIPEIRVGNTSRPIAVTTPNAPHQSLIVTVEISNELT